MMGFTVNVLDEQRSLALTTDLHLTLDLTYYKYCKHLQEGHQRSRIALEFQLLTGGIRIASTYSTAMRLVQRL
jgi:hypothetical protein